MCFVLRLAAGHTSALRCSPSITTSATGRPQLLDCCPAHPPTPPPPWPARRWQVRAAYVEKVSGKIGDLFRGYWAIMDRLEVRVRVRLAAHRGCGCVLAWVGQAGGSLGDACRRVAGGGRCSAECILELESSVAGR